MRLLVAALLVSLLLVGSEAFAQAHAGAAIVVSRLPGLDYTPGTIDRPPGGLDVGGVFSGGAALTTWLGLQGELSIPARLTADTIRSSRSADDPGSLHRPDRPVPLGIVCRHASDVHDGRRPADPTPTPRRARADRSHARRLAA